MERLTNTAKMTPIQSVSIAKPQNRLNIFCRLQSQNQGIKQVDTKNTVFVKHRLRQDRYSYSINLEK